MRHLRGYTLRVPYIDVNIVNNQFNKFEFKFIDVDGPIVLNGILMTHPKAIHDDILRVLFRETGWAPWVLDDEKKCSRRTKRLCGLTLLLDYPKIQRWGVLCDLVDKVRDMDAAFSYSGRRDCVLRELGCLSAHGGVFFNFCASMSAPHSLLRVMLFVRTIMLMATFLMHISMHT